MGHRGGEEECSIQMEGYYENMIPVGVAFSTGRQQQMQHQTAEQAQASGKYFIMNLYI
jgi:hypothetical protein